MANKIVPHFQNDSGQSSISIGSKEFMCIGASPPFDHPHVFLDIGSDSEIVCPYCSTIFKYEASLGEGQSDPADCIWSGS